MAPKASRKVLLALAASQTGGSSSAGDSVEGRRRGKETIVVGEEESARTCPLEALVMRKRGAEQEAEEVTPAKHPREDLGYAPPSFLSSPDTLLHQLLSGPTPIPSGLSTLWDAASNEKVVDEHLFRGADVKLYQKLGRPHSNRLASILGLRLASLARWQELEAIKSEKNMADLINERDRLKQKIVRDMNLVNSAADVAKELDEHKSALAKLQEENNLSQAKVLSLEEANSVLVASQAEKLAQLESSRAKVENLKQDLHNMTVRAGQQLSIGFNLAREQACCLNPESDYSAMHPMKDVKDGQLVDHVSEDEEEDTAGED